MKKSLIAVAVAGAFASSLAHAADAPNVTIYGKVDVAVGTTNNGATSTNQVSSQVTKIGFKGAEDLGGGTSAIWHIEQQIDIDGGTGAGGVHNTWAGRNSFLGLKGDSYGTFLAGRHDTAYKIATRHQDVFGDQFADNRTIMGGVGQDKGGTMDTRPTDELMWLSPNWGGLKIAASYVLGAERASAAADVKGGLTALGVVYDQGKSGPLYLAVATQTITYGSAGTGQYAAPAGFAANDSIKSTKFGAGYHADMFKVNVILEKISSSVAGQPVDLNARTNTHVNAQFNIDDANDIKVAYTKAGNTGSVANTGATEIGLGFDHKMSKRTTVYAQYAKISNGSAANYQFGTAASTAATTATAATLGKSPSGILVGMKHSF